MKTNIFFLILISLFFINSADAQKKITITGTVLDADKGPIANAIIMIDGVKTSSMTDAQGKFKVKIKPTAIKIGVVTFGAGIKEEAIDGRTDITINFGTASTQKDQELTQGETAVDVGYGRVKNKNVTGPVKKIDGSNKKYASYTSIYEMIERECSGVKVNKQTGAIVIQGAKDLWGEIPALIVVDGVPTDRIDYLSPTSVKSIEVLKGSAAAMYGSRGYGGAILIKTKIQND